MGSSKTPEVVHPGEAAQAAMGTAAAGEQMAIANQPLEEYGNLMTTEQLGPAQMQTQQALANQAAYQGALAQRDIQSRVDPQAYAQREMRMQSANKRLGDLYGVDPKGYSFSAPQAYAVPGMDASPSMDQLQQLGAAVASRLSVGSVNKAGADPQLLAPSNVIGTFPTTTTKSYY